ncbi:MAG: carboxylate-amine ligase, partial [Chloroflexi bacterium]
WLWKLRRSNITFRVYRRDLIEENRWRASRYGLDGKMIDFGKTQEVPTRQLIRELLELVAEEVDELGIAAYLEPIERMLALGTSADRQLRVYDSTDGDLRAVVDHLIAESKEGLEI